jgi:hypothetical protein
VIERQPDWDVDDPQCPGCELLSRGLLLAAVYELRSNKTIQKAMISWQNDLMAAQLPNGSWLDDTQSTAYIVMGLARIGASAVRAAVARGRDFLLSLQLPSGGYAVAVTDTSENTEVNSEVMQALNAAP